MTAKPDTLLARLEKERVFSVATLSSSFLISEECDCYYTVTLSKDELAQLGQELIELSKEI